MALRWLGLPVPGMSPMTEKPPGLPTVDSPSYCPAHGGSRRQRPSLTHLCVRIYSKHVPGTWKGLLLNGGLTTQCPALTPGSLPL